MAVPMEYTPSFMHNLQAQYATTFDMAVKLGLVSLGLEVGQQVVYFAYDKARKAWQPRGKAGEVLVLKDAAAPESEMSLLRQQNFDERFAEARQDQADDNIAEGFAKAQLERRPLIPEEADWARRSKEVAQQPQQVNGEPLLPPPLQPTVKSQKQRLESGQQMVPVDDHDHNHDDNHDNNNHDTTYKAIDLVGGARPDRLPGVLGSCERCKNIRMPNLEQRPVCKGCQRFTSRMCWT